MTLIENEKISFIGFHHQQRKLSTQNLKKQFWINFNQSWLWFGNMKVY